MGGQSGEPGAGGDGAGDGGGGGAPLQATVASAVSLVPSAKLICARNGHDPLVHPVDITPEYVCPCVACGAGAGAGAVFAFGFGFAFAQWRSARWRFPLSLMRRARLEHCARARLARARSDVVEGAAACPAPFAVC